MLAVDHRRRRARRGLAHHAAGRRVEPGPRRARRERGALPGAGAARHRRRRRGQTSRGTVQYISPAVDTVFGRPSDEPRRHAASPTTSTTTAIDQSHALYRALRRPPRRAGRHRVPRVRRRRAGGGSRPRGPTSCTNRRSRGIVGNLRDITDRKRVGAFARGRDAGARAHPLRRARCPRRSRASSQRARGRTSPTAPVPSGCSTPSDGTLECVAAPSLPGRLRARRWPSTPRSRTSRRSSARPRLHVLRDIEHDGARPERQRRCASRTACAGSGRCPIRIARRQPSSSGCSASSSAPCASRKPERARGARAGARPRRGRDRPRRPHQGARAPRAARHAHRPAQPRARAGPARARARTPRQRATTTRWSRCCSSTSTASSW